MGSGTVELTPVEQQREVQRSRALALERELLGRCLLAPEALADVGDLTPSDFSLPRHRTIYMALVESHAETGATDPMAVGRQLLRVGQLDEVGGHEQLMDLTEDVVSAAGAADDARELLELSRRRRLRGGLQVALRQLDAGAPIDEIGEVARQAIGDDSAPRTGFCGDLTQPMPAEWLDLVPDPPRWLLRHPTRDGAPCEHGAGDGLLRLGKVGLLTSAGGVGKTSVLLDLAVSIATGRPWLGHFQIDPDVRGDVVLLLAEEDEQEVRRRIWWTMDALGLTVEERVLVQQRLRPLGLAGQSVALAESSPTGPRPTTNVRSLLRALEQLDEVALVVADPLARFAGVPVDVDNMNATLVVELFERIAQATGASVLVAAHSSKASRTTKSVDVRGPTAFVDGVRWVAGLTADGDAVKFEQLKSNYSRPMPKLNLVRERGGRLRAMSPAEVAEQEEDREDRKQTRIERHARELTTVLAAAATPITNVNEGLKLVKGDQLEKRAGWDHAVAEGWIRKDGRTWTATPKEGA